MSSCKEREMEVTITLNVLVPRNATESEATKILYAYLKECIDDNSLGYDMYPTGE